MDGGRGDDSFRHAALIAGRDEDLLAALVPELRRSVEVYDEVLLVVSEHRRHLLMAATTDLGDALTWGDPGGFYQRLGFAYERFRRYLAERQRAGRRVHVIAEPDLTSGVDAGTRGDRAAAYLAYEAVCNDAFEPYGSPVTCIWDSRHHPRAVIDGARAAHRHLLTVDGFRPSPQFLAPDRFLGARRHSPLPAPPEPVDRDRVLHDVAELGELRSVLGKWTAGHGFSAAAAEDVVAGVVEIATNGLRHGLPPVRVRAWHARDTLILQCDDVGGRPVPPGAGYHRPQLAGARPGGRGLWLARQLADVVLIESVPGRTSVRLHFPYGPLHRAED